MKPVTIISGAIGAAIGAAAWYFYATSGPLRDALWAPLLVGVLAGVGARLLAEPIVRNYRRGAIIAAIALLAMVVAQKGVSYAVQQQSDALEASSPPVVIEGVFTETEPTAESPDDASEVPETGSPELATDPADSETPETYTDGGAEEDPTSLKAALAAQGMTLPEGVDSEQISELRTAMKAGMAAQPVEESQPLIDPKWLLALSYAVGMLLAYTLGKGPSLLQSSDAVLETPVI